MRFLVVEDEPVARKLLFLHLTGLGLCDVAHDGEHGVEAFRLALEQGQPYDLICLDIMMPGMNGHEVLAHIRSIEESHGVVESNGVKVIVTTALDDANNVSAAFRAGCEAYLVKPICKERLFAEMQKLGLDLETSSWC